jgi:hypothetical protein
MTHSPPVPEGNTSPYPLHPAPTAHHEEPNAASDATTKGARSKDSRSEDGDVPLTDRLSERLGDIDMSDTRTIVGIGAGVALGAAAVVAAFLFNRSDKKGTGAGTKAKRRGKSRQGK